MGLNLLPSVAKFQVAKIRLKKSVNLYMIILLGIWLIAMVTIISTWMIRKNKLKITKTKYDKTYNEYKKKNDLLALSQRLKYQAKAVGEVLVSRFEYGTAIESVNKLMPEEINIDDFKIKTRNEFEINYSTNDGKNINKLENKVDQINKGKIPGFAYAEITSLENEEPKWTFRLVIKTK